nr:glycosyltransferase [uncultured Halomonas sp.]
MSRRLSLMVAGDPAQRTGGYLYDAHIVAALREQGWEIDVIGLAGTFPDTDATASSALAQALGSLADHTNVVIDGLAMGALPEVVANHSQRLDITALLHHPLGDELGLNEANQQRFHRSELAALAAVKRIIVTSHFTARRLPELAARYAMPLKASVTVVEPGVAQAPISPSADSPSEDSPSAEPEETLRLLCVATLTPRKGQDILVHALAGVERGRWRCDCFGAARDAAFTDSVQALIDKHQLGDWVTLHGECDSETLESAYRHAHALVLPSWYEGYGMVVTEALAHGLPVITTTGGALRDTLPAGAGLSVEPGDSQALQDALSRFCTDPALRQQLRQGAIHARNALSDWQAAGAAFAKALSAQNGSASDSTNDTQAMQAGSQFASDWLTLREAADFASRSQPLAVLASEWLSARTQTPLIADLGCGRGSNMRFLAPRLLTANVNGSQRWKLIDHDAALLEQAREQAAGLSDSQGQPVAVEDGQIFAPWEHAGDPPEVLWQDIERIRDHYAWSVDYAVNVTGRWTERVVDDNTLMIILGDHQAAPLITGDDASAAVPVHIISGDPALLEPFMARGFVPGTLPALEQAFDAPRMSQLRHWLQEDFGELEWP